MTIARISSLALLLAGGLALLRGPAAAQDRPVEKMTVSDLRDLPNGLAEEDAPKARDTLKTFAKRYAAIVADARQYKASQEFTASGVTLDLDRPPSSDPFFDLNTNLLLEQQSGQYRSKAAPKHAVYLRELGAALDESLRDLIENSKEPIVRVNAARVLAHVCRAGSPAHYPTLTKLIADPNTRTEIKYYLFQAAGHLLAAPDLRYPKTRNHPAQTAQPDLAFGLVQALERCVTDPALVLSGLPADKAAGLTEAQADVVALVRRQAIMALSQARYAAFRNSDEKMTYPAHTLARVALSDPSLVPAPGPADAAEAAIGLMNMSPAFANGEKRVPVGYNGAAAAEAVAAALVAFASKRAEDDGGRLLPWRGYAARLGEALYHWPFLFDIGYDPGGPVTFDPSRVPAPVEGLRKTVPAKILYPLANERVPGKQDVDTLIAELSRMKNDKARKPALFEGVPRTTIDLPAAK